jgi:zinc protease
MKFLVSLVVSLLLSVPASAAIDIQEVTTPGGLDAWLVEEPGIPFVALELRFRGGASLDREGKRGATNLMMAMLEEGAGDMDARAFTERSEELAARFRYDAYDDVVTVGAKFLVENKDEAIALLRETLVNPTFDEDAIERVRAQIESGIRSSLKDPDSIAAAAFDKAAFGDHPYGTSPDGTLESVAALTRDDLVAAQKGVMRRDNVYIGAAGDISADELSTLLDDLLGDLPETGWDMPEPAKFALKGGIDVVPYDTPQSVAIFGQEGIDRDDPDFFPAFVMNNILGGGSFESRLMNEVREKRGLTYGVSTSLMSKDHANVYRGRFASANDRIAEAISVIRDEWAKMATEGVTQEELDQAKTYLTGSYPLRFDGNGPIANILVGMQVQGLSTDYIATRNDKVNAVTLDDIKRVAKRLLRPDDLHFTVVGQPVGLEDAPGQ